MALNISSELDSTLEDLAPAPVWEHFNAIRQIPRESKNEKGVSDYVEQWAHSNGLKCFRDEIGNVCVKVPASPDFEDKPPVCLQAHSDMVCVKKDESKHDFDKDPIKLKKDGKLLKSANGTTLGADNGIGVATAMALATDPEVKHPPLEILITVQEEIGLYGAFALDPKAFDMKSERVINLDSEKPDEICVTSAGLQKATATRELSDLDRVDVEEMYGGHYYEINLTSLRGGHSGVNIHESDRGNAILGLADFLDKIPLHDGMKLISMEGGKALNAIPASAKAIIFVKDDGNARLSKTLISTFAAAIQNFFMESWGTEVSVNTKLVSPEEVKTGAISDKTRRDIFHALRAVPHGRIEEHPKLPGLTGTSANLATVKISGDKAEIGMSVRSEAMNKMGDVTQEIGERLKEWGFKLEKEGASPSWDGDPDSPLVRTLIDTYADVTSGGTAETVGVHGGLETGVLVPKLEEYLGKKVDAAAVGAHVQDAHSPDESVDVESVVVLYNQVKLALERI